MASNELSDRDQAILEFERLTWKYRGAKETAIREHFDMSEVRYSQILNRLIDQPAALAYDGMLVKRLQRRRDALRARRSANRGVPVRDRRATS